MFLEWDRDAVGGLLWRQHAAAYGEMLPKAKTRQTNAGGSDWMRSQIGFDLLISIPLAGMMRGYDS